MATPAGRLIPQAGTRKPTVANSLVGKRKAAGPMRSSAWSPRAACHDSISAVASILPHHGCRYLLANGLVRSLVGELEEGRDLVELVNAGEGVLDISHAEMPNGLRVPHGVGVPRLRGVQG